MKQISFLGIVLALLPISVMGQSRALYSASSQADCFLDVLQLSDATLLVSGWAEDLDWIDPSVPRIELDGGDINNGLGSGKYGMILHFSANADSILHVVHFGIGEVEDIRFMKTTNIPGEPTGQLFISGNTEDTESNNGGYFLAKLNNNFVDGVPDACVWTRNVWAVNYPKQYQPWDVTGEGELYYISGESHGYDWSAVYKLDQAGNRVVVEHWRTHWLNAGGEWKGTPASSYSGGVDALAYSGIVLKIWGRCELRSWTDEAFDWVGPDGNGGTKKGQWPADFLFDSPCDPDAPVASGPGYTGYSAEACCPVWGGQSVAVDRRNGHVYIGMNFKSYAVDFNSPDFEPAVIAMDETGALKWWSRLYHEITPEGQSMISLPDQYIDALRIDYSSPPEEGSIVVGARCHGNNTENLWEGDEIAVNPTAGGFQNRFTGTMGDIHVSWIGKLSLSEGQLRHSTYMAEYAEGTGNLGVTHPDPNLDGWPDPNSGWPNVNTTYIRKNAMKVTSDGSVVVLGTGRRTITTANAFQKMVLPQYGGQSCWNEFVRQYAPDLSVPVYSSLLVGQWDTLTQAGGSNVSLYGVWKTADGLVVVGQHSGEGEEIPVSNVPSWGASSHGGASAVLGYFRASELNNPFDGPAGSASIHERAERHGRLEVFPNPSDHIATFRLNGLSPGGLVNVINAQGQRVFSFDLTASQRSVSTEQLAPGVYTIVYSVNGTATSARLVVQ